MPRILRSSGAPTPLVAHIPHASTKIPPEVRAEIVLADDELADELLRLTDWYTDELFAGLAGLGATLFINDLSRLVFDPERLLDDSAEPMASRGQGVVYWTGSELQLIRAASAELRARRVRELYAPYHAALDALVGGLLDDVDTCTVVDCHSFPTTPLHSEIDQSPDRPDICIGADETHTPVELADALVASFTAAGLRVARDTPFSGAFVPSGYYGRDSRVHSVMIEVRRGLYMNEASGKKSPDFDSLAETITRAVGSAPLT